MTAWTARVDIQQTQHRHSCSNTCFTLFPLTTKLSIRFTHTHTFRYFIMIV